MAAERDSEVLLVDADFAKPSVLSLLGLTGDRAGGKGLMDALSDPSVRVEDCVIATDLPGLYVLPAGNRTASDSEYLASARTSDVLDRLTHGAPNRTVIFDSPPALAASTAAELARNVGQGAGSLPCRSDRANGAGGCVVAALRLPRHQTAAQRRAFQPQRTALRHLLRRCDRMKSAVLRVLLVIVGLWPARRDFRAGGRRGSRCRRRRGQRSSGARRGAPAGLCRTLYRSAAGAHAGAGAGQ